MTYNWGATGGFACLIIKKSNCTNAKHYIDIGNKESFLEYYGIIVPVRRDLIYIINIYQI